MIKVIVWIKSPYYIRFMSSRKLKSILASHPLVWKIAKKGQEMQYDLNYARFYGALSTETASITEINLEFCSACNLRCKFCALDHLKPKTYMSLKVLDNVLNTLLTDKRFKRVNQLNLHNGGETLLHPKRMELISRLRFHKEQFKSHGKAFPKVVLLTNGMLLRKELSREILRMDVLDEVGFSLDGGSPEAFEEMRVNAKWQKFSENLTDFVLLKNMHNPRVKTFGICIVPQPNPLNDSWMHPDFQKTARMLDEVEYRRLHDWGGALEIEEGKTVNKKGCAMLMRQMVILPDGDVTVCCNDLNKKGVVGNVLKNDLYSIYKSKERLRYVELLKQGKKDELDLCRDCESF